MAELILVRHGQAQSHARDADSYDNLSDLGHAQARWLGAHMAATNGHFDRVFTGALNRQVQTADSMGYRIDRQDPRLDELDYFALAEALEAQFGVPAPNDPTEFAAHLPEVIGHWTGDRLRDVPERFAQFQSRVSEIVDELCEGHGRILVVTSGGVIGMVIRHVLGLDNGGMAKIMLQVMNSSVHRLEFVNGQLLLGAFNATPHLDAPDRAHARTFI